MILESWRRPWLRWAAVFLWMGMIFWLSSRSTIPFLGTSFVEYVIRKIGHMVVFGILALLVYVALPAAWDCRQRAWLAAPVAIVYAVIDELHQALVPGRHATLTDVLIDTAGIAVVLAGLIWWTRRCKGEAEAARRQKEGQNRSENRHAGRESSRNEKADQPKS